MDRKLRALDAQLRSLGHSSLSVNLRPGSALAQAVGAMREERRLKLFL